MSSMVIMPFITTMTSLRGCLLSVGLIVPARSKADKGGDLDVRFLDGFIQLYHCLPSSYSWLPENSNPNLNLSNIPTTIA